MTKKHWRTRYPLEGFDPRFATLLKQAVLRTAEDPLIITFLNHKEAFTFTQRIYQFRGKAREEDHEDWKLFMRVRCSRKANILRMFAQDSQFDDAFAQAGVEDQPDRPRLGPDEDIMSDPDLAALLSGPSRLGGLPVGFENDEEDSDDET
jgi:hypothetical protein